MHIYIYIYIYVHVYNVRLRRSLCRPFLFSFISVPLQPNLFDPHLAYPDNQSYTSDYVAVVVNKLVACTGVEFFFGGGTGARAPNN